MQGSRPVPSRPPEEWVDMEGIRLDDREKAEVADMLNSPGWAAYKKWAQRKAAQISETAMDPESEEPTDRVKGKYWGFLQATEGFENEFRTVAYVNNQNEDKQPLAWSGYDTRANGPKAGVRH